MIAQITNCFWSLISPILLNKVQNPFDTGSLYDMMGKSNWAANVWVDNQCVNTVSRTVTEKYFELYPFGFLV